MNKRQTSNVARLPPTDLHPTSWPLFVIAGVFALSRVGYYVAGVRFDASSLPWFWQFIDPALLKADLGQNLWFLQSQPPAFNLFLGLVLNLFPGHEAMAFAECYHLMGLAFGVILFLLLREFAVPDTLSVILTAAYIVSPACVLYENWLFYSYPLMVLLLLAALFWHRAVLNGRFIDLLMLFMCAALLALTWSLFHLVWLLLLVVMLISVRRRDWRRVLAAGAVPVLVVVFWYGKNLVQVGQFTASTWFGINFSKMTNSMLTAPERRALYDDGTISAVSLVPPFSQPDRYGTVPKPNATGVPVLNQEMKPSGTPNFNNLLYIAVSRQYGRDALRILASRPLAYLRGLAESYLIYFLPASAYLFLEGNAARVRALERFFSTVVNGRFSYYSDSSLRIAQPARYYLQGLLNDGWFLILAYAFALIFGLLLLLRGSRSHFVLPASSMLFIWFNVAWITVIANALEVGENNRFRFITDPLVLVLIAAVASDWLRQRGRPKQPIAAQ